MYAHTELEVETRLNPKDEPAENPNLLTQYSPSSSDDEVSPPTLTGPNMSRNLAPWPCPAMTSNILSSHPPPFLTENIPLIKASASPIPIVALPPRRIDLNNLPIVPTPFTRSQTPRDSSRTRRI